MVKRILLATPRGYCAGVERAIETVEQALRQRGAPVYVRKRIVHNTHVVRELEGRGAIFVGSEEDAPTGAEIVFSAHGVSPAVRANARRLGLRTIDATCPLVTKVHSEVRRFAARGYSIVLIGHAGHEEVEGTFGEAPEAIVLVENIDQARVLELPRDRPLAYVTQTTLSVDETETIIGVLQARFPAIEAPRREDICYATTNRQRAVKRILGGIDLLLVLGSADSSNSKRLVEVARRDDVTAHLIEDESEIEESWLSGVETVGITCGASAPEVLVRRVVSWFRARGDVVVETASGEEENVSFKLPAELGARATAA
ncbi:MAG: 4-hydroxy-3-methylbut-2-enyl diphosphate reductase [Gaiellaceae bacterium]